MAEGIEPPLRAREPRAGPDGQFYLVTIAELHTCRALLMQGGRDKWARRGSVASVISFGSSHAMAKTAALDSVGVEVDKRLVSQPAGSPS